MVNRLFFVVLSLLLSPLSFAESFEAGKDYVIVKNDVEHKQADAVNVTEFFSYGCPWCYRLESGLNQWARKKENVINYQQIPVIFHKDWELYAKAYYTAQALSLESKLSPLLFKAILEEKKSLNTSKVMIEFFKKHGVSEEVATSAFLNSSAIDMEVKNSQRLMAAYQINAVPALVVNHKYKTDLQMAKSQERLYEILDYLVEKAEKEKSAD